MAEDIRISVGADTTQMESQIANAARKASVVIRPTIDSKGLERISAPLGRITGQADEFSKSMEAANARVLAFGASVGVLNAVAKSFQNIVTASTQVEASLKEIQVATGETSGNLEKLGKGIFEVARSTGLSFKQASEATLEFARQGGTLEDSLMKAKAALVLTRTTGLDAAEAVKGLTAAVLSFNQVGLDYETVVNKLAAVDTKFAVSSRDLIEGISRSASVAQEAGVSFDELTALITTLQEKTARGGAVIGNALKTIFQRVQTTENLDYIRNLGIAVNDVSGDILPATTIIKKLADEFQNLDSATRKGLLIKIGGGFQIDKLAALLNDISNANGTFNRSLEQSSNAGNQGFRKLEELNKTVQASFDRLTTSGTEFAATVGKIAFSDDFRSILNKTSSFLESLNESISGGEEGGATIGKSIVKGIGSIITGPGALLLAGLGIKLFGDLAKFGVDSLKNQLGVTNVKKEQQDIEKSILGLLLQNTAVQTKIVSLEGNKAAQAEYLLGLYSKQAATLEKMSKLSKDIGPSVYESGIRLTTEGTKNVKSKTAAGGYMSKDAARKMEMQEAPAGASIREISNFNFGPTEGKGTMIVNSMESVYKTPMGDFVVPSYSKTRTGKPTLFSASGYVPNFAEEKQKENLLRNLNIDGGAYSFAGLTIGGTGSKAVRAKEVTPQILSQIKDPVLSEALSKYSKLNFSNVSVGNIYRRRDENLDSLQASEKDIKDHFVKKANSALSPQIGTFIKDELSSLGVKPTATMQYMMKNGRKFDFVNDSMAGTFFETMLKMANMSAEDDNFGQFFNDSNSRFDIYGLKPDIAEQYGLPKKFWEYVEIKSSEKALNDEIGTKFIQQLSQAGGESLKSKFLAQAKTGAKGYVPNFAEGAFAYEKTAKELNLKSNANKVDASKKAMDSFTGNISPVYQKKTIDEYTEESQQIVGNIVKKLGKTTGKKIDNDALTALLTKFRKSGVDISKRRTLRTAIENLDPKNKSGNSGYLNVINIVKGILGEIDASKLSGQSLTKGNAFLDLVSGDEVKTTKIQTGSEVFKKVVNDYLVGHDLKNNKTDKINLGSRKVYIPKETPFTAAQGYVPNFAGTTNFEGSASRYGYKIGQVYNKGEEAIKATFNNPTTAFSGTVTGKESYGRKYGVTVDEKGIIASILGNNTFVAGEDQRRELESLATRLSAQGAMAKGSGFNIAGLQGGRLATNPDQVITANIKGKFKKIDYEKLDKIFPRFWKSKGLGDVWEKTKLAATYKASPTSYSEIIKDRPDLQETLSSSNLLRQNNTLLRDAAVEAVLKRDPSVAGFLVDIANSSDETFLKQQGYGDVGIKYAMPFSGKPFSDIENKAVKEEKIQSQLDAKRKADRYKNEIESFKKYGLDYKIYGPSKEKYKALGTWGNYDPVSKKIFLLSETARTAAKGYIPNFSKEAILDAISREQKESGLPLSAIKVVQDARVRGAQNPDGYAVINNRDEPDGKVPNFAAPSGMNPELIKAIEDSLRNLQNSSKSLDDAFKNIATNLGVSGDTVIQVLDRMTSSGSAAAETSKQIVKEGGKEADAKNKGAKTTKESKDKETKTVQDSLYTLLKWQTVLSFASGGISAFGEKTSKVAEALSSFGTTVLSLTEGQKAIKSLAFGKEDANILGRGGALNKVRRLTAAGYEANGLGGAAAGFARAGGARAIAGAAGVAGIIALGTVEAFKGLDSALELFDGSIQRSADTMDGLAEMQKKFGISLSESQKRIIESSSSPIGSGRGIAGFFNEKSFLAPINIFTTKLEDQLTKTFGKTGLNEAANKQLYSTIAATREPIIEQRLKQERADQLKKSGKEVPPLQEIKIPSTLIQQELQKETKDIFEFARQNVLQKYEKESKQIKVPTVVVDDLSSPIIGGDTKVPLLGKKREAKYKQKNIEDVTSEAYKKRLDLLYKIEKKEVDNADVLYELQDLLEKAANESNSLQASAKLIEESFLYSVQYLKNQLSVSSELLKIQNSIASSEENVLKFRRDNVRTSDAEKTMIDYKLQSLEAERSLRSEIQQSILNSARSQVDKFIDRKGGNVTEEEAAAITKLYQGLAQATKDGKNVEEIFNQFVVSLTKADQSNVKLLGNLGFLGKEQQNNVNVMKEAARVKQAELQSTTLLNAIQSKITFEYEAQKQFVSDKISLQKSSLDLAEKELANARAIRDTRFDRSLLGLSPRTQEIAKLNRQASSQTENDQLKDLSIRRSKANVDYREQLIQKIIETNKNADLTNIEGKSNKELEGQFKAGFQGQASQLDEAINAATKAGETFDTGVKTAADSFNLKINDNISQLFERYGIKQDASFQLKQFEDFKNKGSNFNPKDFKLDQSSNAVIDPFAAPTEKLDMNNMGFGNAEKVKQNFEEAIQKAKGQLNPDNETRSIQAEAALKALRARTVGQIPANETNRIQEEQETARKQAELAKKQMSDFGAGFKMSLQEINDEIDGFNNKLGKQIPMNFRDGLVDAMKALSDPNATNSLKERLMGVASAFLNKINDALMTNAANKITGGIGSALGFASGGPIKGGSGTKDDVPAMLMGGEYVIKKTAVNKYGKDFFDKLNSGKMKGFANGGLVETDLKDLIKNPTKYTPYGETRMDNLSFDESGKVIGMQDYKGSEENKQNALQKAQTDFYAKKQQSGEGGFFMPGTYGQGAIMGQKNLLAYATQQTTGTQYDKISSKGSAASIDLAAGSGNLSLFALRDQGNVRNAQYLESKNKALDLYFGGIDASKEKIKMDYENQKQYEAQKKAYEDAKKQARKAMLMQIGTTVAMAGISALGNAAMSGKTAAQQAFASGQPGAEKPGFFTGMFSGAKINGETFGGIGNALKFDSNAFKTANLLGAKGGALSWNARDQSYQPLTTNEYNAIAPMGASWSKGSVGTPYSWQRKAAGGFVAGNGMGDNVPAMLNGGEFVVSKQAAQKTGYGNLQKLNSTGATGGDSSEMTTRIESKLEELVEKIAGVGTINISVNSDGKGGEKESQSDSRQDQQNKELARRIKEVVLSVLRDEKRLGGMLR